MVTRHSRRATRWSSAAWFRVFTRTVRFSAARTLALRESRGLPTVASPGNKSRLPTTLPNFWVHVHLFLGPVRLHVVGFTEGFAHVHLRTHNRTANVQTAWHARQQPTLMILSLSPIACAVSSVARAATGSHQLLVEPGLRVEVLSSTAAHRFGT